MTNEKALQKFDKTKKQHLVLSVVLDVLGMLTYTVPLFGELGDVIFAPFYGIAIFAMYRKQLFSAAAGGILGTIEELLPSIDVIPTATIMWVYTYIFRKDKTLRNFVEEKNKEINTLNSP